jgi:hypothetical protein
VEVTNTGGSSSFGPPSGLPVLAQKTKEQLIIKKENILKKKCFTT